MNPPLAIDLCRLFLGLAGTTPRGIDRVELGYAQHLLNSWAGPCFMTMPTPWGIRCFDRNHALRMVGTVASHWREDVDADDDPAYRRFLNQIKGDLAPHGPVELDRSRRTSAAAGFLRLAAEPGFALGRSVHRTLPNRTIYLNVGQIGLASRRVLGWLNRRPDVTAVFMLHDTIPIDHPEFVPPVARDLHRKMVVNTARHASGLIVTTDAAKDSIDRQLALAGRTEIPTVVAHLPLQPQFHRDATPDPRLDGKPYFLMCGSFDPRKNHSLVLNVWRSLVQSYGDDAPLLVLVGKRSRANPQDIAMIERCDPLRKHVIEISNLSTPALQRLMLSARALLMPSFAEGFGLPVAEALSCGTPVIASDIAAHREVGNGYATLLSPIDGRGWLKSIRAHLSDEINYGIRLMLQSYRPTTQSAYFDRIGQFIRERWQDRSLGAAVPVPQAAPDWHGEREPAYKIS